MKGDSEEMSSDNVPDIVIPPPEVLPEGPQVKIIEKEKERKGISAQFTEWLQKFETEQSPEKKIRLTIDFMRASLSQDETPRFKDFWECRRLCLVLFKENISTKVRSSLWGEYVELSNEARRLKEILDERSAFAIEQIELAIQSIESDLEHFNVLLEHTAAVAFPKENVSLKEKKDLYNSIQKELQLLNTLAMRINGMRKEIIKTEMRIRIKNKLLERLSVCGDRVFPKRKELIKNISQEFMSDVEHFIQAYFQTDECNELPLHILREEIKFLQLFAKILTLNTETFTAIRHMLSECWDKIKSQEKDRKKEVFQKKQIHRQNYEMVLEKAHALAVDGRAGLSVNECIARAQDILEYMKSVELGRDEVKALREELAQAKKIVFDQQQDKENQRALKEKEIETKRRERINALKEELSSYVQSIEQYDIDLINVKREEMLVEFDKMALSKIEKQIVDRLFKQLKDAVAGKREKVILALSEDDLKSLEQLKELLKERLNRRTEIKNQIEHYRKAVGGSGFDFEKAMMHRELIESEKSSLERIDAAIEELEQKIEEIES